ncbi:hypothetical protein pipiens_006768 [Culex pipiens pipiens]|uniref:Uncharacterized protein n=1 Tax=Culex pipiens pipiens TaxID=38569 RepID=A0ABD1DNA3_CULPP
MLHGVSRSAALSLCGPFHKSQEKHAAETDSSQSNHASGCFTGDSTVQTINGEHRKLSELQIGEKVLSVDSSGSVVYSEVMMFMDRDTHQSREFVHIETDGGAHLTVTPAHLVMVWQKEIGESRYLFADRIQEGDYVLVNIDNNLEPRKVLRISAKLSQGVYAPLTSEGTVLVDSIAASCYALIDSQSVAHLSFLPYRVVQKLQGLTQTQSSLIGAYPLRVRGAVFPEQLNMFSLLRTPCNDTANRVPGQQRKTSCDDIGGTARQRVFPTSSKSLCILRVR